MIDSVSDRAVFRQLADDIRAQIQAGRLRPGQRLRTEPEYGDDYGISRDSVRKAMALLRQEGLIVTSKQGSRVKPAAETVDVAIPRDTRVNVRMPTEPERRRLGLAEGVPVFVVSRPGADAEVLPGDQTSLVVE
jgi:DNA-binding GntR family transcriptional regulator